MKLPFRAAILCVLLGLIITTVTIIGVSSFYNARLAAKDLSEQIMEQVSLGIDDQVESLLSKATERSILTTKLLESGQYSKSDLEALLRFWTRSLEASPGITSQFIGLAETGESAGVSRLEDGMMSIWQTTRDPLTKSLRLKEFHASDYPRSAYREGSANDAPDVRTRPWFVAARRVGRPTWTESYVFLGVGKVKHVLGLTYATPFFGPDGQLDSVVSVDFDLGTLSEYLDGLKVGRSGFAFLIELRENGCKVIAHPRPELLTTGSDSGSPSLVELGAIDDSRIRLMLEKIPGGPDRPTLSGPSTSRFMTGGVSYIGNFRPISGDDKPRWIICTVLPENEILGFAHRTNRSTLLVTLGSLATAILIGIYVSGQVARPLEHLAREADRVGHLRLTPRPIAHSFVLEVDRLAVASEEMKSGLRSFRKYVPAELVRTLIDSGQDARLGGERRRLTIFFSDIENFTTISENSDPEAIVEQLGDYFAIFNDEILEARGTVDKYIGDSVMAFWGAPEPVDDHASAACRAALRIQARLAEITLQWQAEGKPVLNTRIGIHTGEVLVGNIGNDSRMNYTVVGDAVNLASRLEGMNKQFHSKILISEHTFQEAGPINARPLGPVTVKGRAGAVHVYELLESETLATTTPDP